MAGYSRVTIFTPAGLPITQIDVATKRSWLLNGVGRCEFTINIYDSTNGGINPDCSQNNFQYGNLMLVQHTPSKNADGSTNGILPDWAGIILPPQNWTYGKLTVTAYSAENILLYRPFDKLLPPSNPPAGGIFAAILAFINARAVPLNGIAIQPGSIDLSGPGIYRWLTAPALNEVMALSQSSGQDFDVLPSLDSNNRLTLTGNWYVQKGVVVNQLLSNVNMQNADPIYTEQGEIYNAIYGWTDSTADAYRATAVSIDQTQLGINGFLGLRVTLPGTAGKAQGIVQAASNAFLAASKKPLRTLAPTVLDVGNTFSYLAPGNIWNVELDTVGWLNGGIGLQGQMRLIAMEYDELSNSVKFAGAML